jgi:hypothetical protein
VARPQCCSHGREQVTLLTHDVVAHVLDQHPDLGVEPFAVVAQPVDLGTQPLDDMVLLEAIQHIVRRVGHLGAYRGVEVLFPHRGVQRQIPHDPLHQVGLRGLRPLERPEQPLDLAVACLEQRDGTRDWPPRYDS